MVTHRWKEKKEAETEQRRPGGGREGEGRRQDPNNNETRVEVVSSRETPIMKYSSQGEKIILTRTIIFKFSFYYSVRPLLEQEYLLKAKGI